MDSNDKLSQKYKETNLFTGSSFNMKVFEVVHTQNPVLKFHWHDYLEILYFVEGHAAINVGAGIYEVSSGDVLFVNSRQIHSGNSLDNSLVKYYAIVIDQQLFSSDNNDPYYKKFIQPYIEGKRLFTVKVERNNPYYKKLKVHLKNIINEYKESRPGFEIKIKISISSLIIDYIRNYIPIESANIATEGNNADTKSISDLISYIYLTCPRKMSIEDAAEYVNLSPFYFCKMFKKVTNQTFIEFFNIFKVNRAEEFLLYTNDSISDIANDLGFCNTNYFDKVFKRVKGCSPSSFRKLMNK